MKRTITQVDTVEEHDTKTQRFDATLADEEYDTRTHMLTLETKYRNPANLFINQRHVTKNIRATVVRWLCETCEVYNFSRSSLFLAVSLFDRVLAKSNNVKLTRVQLIAVTCLVIATKYWQTANNEPLEPGMKTPGSLMPEAAASATDGLVDTEDVINAEALILNLLEFNVTMVTVETMLDLEIEGSESHGWSAGQSLAWCIAETTLLDPVVGSMLPSVVASEILNIVRQVKVFEGDTDVQWPMNLSNFRERAKIIECVNASLSYTNSTTFDICDIARKYAVGMQFNASQRLHKFMPTAKSISVTD